MGLVGGWWCRGEAYLWGKEPLSVMVSHHMVKPTLTMVLAMKTRKTTKALTRRFRKAWKKELRGSQEMQAEGPPKVWPQGAPLETGTGCPGFLAST